MNEVTKNKRYVWLLVGIIIFTALCVFAGIKIIFSRNGNESAREIETRLNAIQRRNDELIASNAQLIKELNETTREFGELRRLNESALELAERSAYGFIELTDTLGSGGSDLAVIIQRQRAINAIVIRLKEENRQSVITLRKGNELGRRDGTASSGK